VSTPGTIRFDHLFHPFSCFFSGFDFDGICLFLPKALGEEDQG
jgi:hypothetical protein